MVPKKKEPAKKAGGSAREVPATPRQTAKKPAPKKRKKPAQPTLPAPFKKIASLAKVTDLRKRKGKSDLQFGGFKFSPNQIAELSRMIDEGLECKVTIEPTEDLFSMAERKRKEEAAAKKKKSAASKKKKSAKKGGKKK
jgi:hypothetical protein